MKPDYQQIVDEAMECFSSAVSNRNLMLAAITLAVERCEALANKPVRELTDAELSGIWQSWNGKYRYDVMRLAIAAHIAKQQEPEEIPFDQKKLDEGGWMVKLGYQPGSNYVVNKVTLVRKQ